MEQNMIEGRAAKSLFLFALPMVIGNLFQQLYNLIDSMVVGNYVGGDALAAVGASFSITLLFIAIATGSGIGCSVVISQYFGAKQFGRMKTAIFTAILSISALSLVLMIFGLVISQPLLELMGTPDNVLTEAVLYLNIYFWGLFFLFLYNILNSIYNAMGESRLPLFFLFLSSLLNIGLDLYFVIYLKMGVGGVAFATLISQGISACFSFFFLMLRLKRIPTEEKFVLFDFAALFRMNKVAVPSIIQQSIVSFGFLLVQSIINRYGSSVMTGYTAATKIDSICIMPMISVGNAVSTFVAQNIGARKPERIKKGYHAGLWMIAGISLTITFIIFLFGEQFINAFLNKKEANVLALYTGTEYLKVVSLFYIVMGFMNVSNGILRGSGDVNVFMICTLSNFSTRVILAFILSGFIEEKAVWWSIPIGWSIGLIIAYLRYRSGRWKEKALI
ncbi:MATE family efflux transporter [Anaeromicropila populeti]|uniref:Probable multidrug resistance protein NorM n=1 Tax=Anaeromicropila populeti TaxID=37658 RepID=A0A1I6KHC7_9FIRM|nr:MATE family efflux transporter [Anaeromicropila populeti]SFR90623.1 putative efflux protein, MATE family [Anaeromicropila populeti]